MKDVPFLIAAQPPPWKDWFATVTAYSDQHREHQPLLCADHVFHDKDKDAVSRFL